MDVDGVTYESFEELVLYCRRVAGAIGRVCLAIFARCARARRRDRAQAEALADELGVALQLTNILRDVREDAENGRVYLPAEDLRRFGVDAPGRAAGRRRGASALRRRSRRRGRRVGRSARSAELVRFEAERAQRVVRARHAARAAARPPQRRVRAGDGRHLPPPARRGSRPIRRGALRARASLPGAREGCVVALRSIAGRGA